MWSKPSKGTVALEASGLLVGLWKAHQSSSTTQNYGYLVRPVLFEGLFLEGKWKSAKGRKCASRLKGVCVSETKCVWNGTGSV